MISRAITVRVEQALPEVLFQFVFRFVFRLAYARAYTVLGNAFAILRRARAMFPHLLTSAS